MKSRMEGTTDAWNYTVSVFLCLAVSLSIMSSGFITLGCMSENPSLVRQGNRSLCVHPTFCVSIHPLMDLSCFLLLATVIQASVNRGVQIPVRPLLPSGWWTWTQKRWPFGNSTVAQFKELRLFLMVTMPFYPPNTSVRGLQFPYFSCHFVIVW